jgi:hypothetical protein
MAGASGMLFYIVGETFLMKKQGTLIIACLAAATAGVAIGMLIAPENGAKIRANLKGLAGDWLSRITSGSDETNLAVGERADEVDAGTPGNS